MRHLSLFILLLVSIGSFAQVKDCSKFRTGTFRYSGTNNSDFVITRNDSIQIEFNKTTNLKYVGAVEWLSDCQYTLTYIEANDPRSKGSAGVKFTVDIISVSENSYKYRAYNNDNEITGEIIKTKIVTD